MGLPQSRWTAMLLLSTCAAGLVGGCRPHNALPVIDPFGQHLTVTALTGQDNYVTSPHDYLQEAQKPHALLDRTGSVLAVVRSVSTGVLGAGPEGLTHHWTVVVASPLIVTPTLPEALEDECEGLKIEVDTQDVNMPTVADAVFIPAGLMVEAFGAITTGVPGVPLPPYQLYGVDDTGILLPPVVEAARGHPPWMEVLVAGGTAVERVRVTVPIVPTEIPVPAASWRVRGGPTEQPGCIPPARGASHSGGGGGERLSS